MIRFLIGKQVIDGKVEPQLGLPDQARAELAEEAEHIWAEGLAMLRRIKGEPESLLAKEE